MSAEAFLNKLHERRLLEESTLTKLRMQVARSRTPVSAETIAKLLVDKGRLTADQANQLLAELQVGPAPGAGAGLDDEELGLAPLDDDELQTAAPSSGPPASAPGGPATGPIPGGVGLTPLPDDGGGLTPLDDSGGLVPLDQPPGPAPLATAPGLTPLEPAASSGSSQLSSVDDSSLDSSEPYAAPLDNDLLGDASSLEADAGPLMPSTLPGAGRGFKGKKVRRNPWESPWLLIGGGLLIFLLMVGAFLAFVLFRGSAQEMFEAAEESYRNGSYSEAIERYEKFLDAFPKDENASKGRVKLALARLRLPVASKSWDRALEVAQKELPAVEQEPAFSEARAELRSLLPDIAGGFTERAMNADETARKEQFVELAEAAMQLVNNPTYLPTSDRTNPAVEKRIDSIVEDIATVHRDINRSKELARALKEISAAVDKSQTAEAYTVYRELLRKYPRLEADESLQEAVRSITKKEQELVVAEAAELTALREDYPPQTELSLVIANRVGKEATNLDGRVIVVMAAGAIYGLDGKTGEVLWRRFVGYETTVHPRSLSSQRDADVIAVDRRRDELLRLRRSDGQLVWRLAVGQPFAPPMILGDRIYLATRSGQLLDVDANSGNVTRRAKLPQALDTGPGGEAEEPYLYQTGSHSNLYVLAKADLSCREVVYLGHQPGGIVVPPVLTRGHLLVAENAGADYCLLHVLVARSRGLQLERAQEPFRLRGHVVLPPVLHGRQVLVVTDRGDIKLYEVNLGGKGKPVTKVAEFTATTSKPVTSYPLVGEGELWIADTRLSRYDIQVASGKLVRRWIKNQADTFVAPLQRPTADVLVHVRRRRSAPGVAVAAVDARKGDPIWRTDLAVPRIGEPLMQVSNNGAITITAQGNLFAITADVLRAGRVTKPKYRPAVTEQLVWLTDLVELDGQRLACTGVPDSERLVSYDPRRTANPLQLATLEKPTASARATAPPVAFAGGLLVPWDNGEVTLLDGRTGKAIADPLAPPRRPGQRVIWRRPAVTEDGTQFVIADNRGKIYRAGLEKKAEPRLVQLQQAGLSHELVSPLTILGQRVYAAARTDQRDLLLAFPLAELGGGQSVPLQPAASGEGSESETAGSAGGLRIVWGPERIDRNLLLVIQQGEASQLVCLDDQSQVCWTSAMPYGPLAGRPLQYDDDFILVSQSGSVWRVDGQDGRELAAAQIGQPCGSGAVALGNSLWINGSDGTLHRVALLRPQANP